MSPPPLEPGYEISGYRLVGYLGRGAMGEVWEAEYLKTREHFALKFLLEEAMTGENALKRFRREAETMAALDHPHIAKVKDWGEEDGRHWLCIELLGGMVFKAGTPPVTTLEDYLSYRGGKLLQTEVLTFMGQFLDALSHAHGQNFVHRDLKPANLLLSEVNCLKIADFGMVDAAGSEWMATQVQATVAATIARVGDATLLETVREGSASSPSSPRNALLGTYAYMSPEQKEGWPATIRSDLYAAGLVCFHMLTGNRSIGFEMPSELDNTLWPGWDDFIRKALRTKPDDRFASASEMSAMLGQVSAQTHATGSEPRPRFQPASLPQTSGGLLHANREVSSSEMRPQGTGDTYPTASRPSNPKQNYLVPGVALEMVPVPAGEFLMGSPGGLFRGEKNRNGDEAQHLVGLTQPFWLAKHLVTQAQWKAVMGDNPSHFEGDDLPVENVSWEDAMAFCLKLNQMDGNRPSGYLYSLPTEAQWEYACRAGTTTATAFEDSLSSRDANFNGDYPYAGAAKGLYLKKTTPVGKYRPNAWGFYDMHGNVWEWCADWYGNYPSGSVVDPTGPSTGTHRVFRGGSWVSYGELCRSANRYRNTPGFRRLTLGFRPSLRSE
jgi:formylglycine-generating enzyme required for sulfatase activity